jgi:hypothetical protein
VNANRVSHSSPSPETGDQPAAAEPRGTEQSPLIVTIHPTPKTQAEAEQDAREHEEKVANDRETFATNRRLVIIGYWQLAVFAGQLLVFGYQAYKLRQTITTTREISGRQERDMRASIAEASRAASAMDKVAASLAASVETTSQMATEQKGFWQRQMRAYVSVFLGGFIPQNRDTPYRYEVQMLMRNTGHRPAHDIRFGSRLVIRPFPLPDDFDFVIPEAEYIASGHINTGQQFFFRRALDTLISDEEITEIMRGNSRKLYIYGTVTYNDAFGEKHYTNFCQFGMWDVSNNFSIININRHNDAT